VAGGAACLDGVFPFKSGYLVLTADENTATGRD